MLAAQIEDEIAHHVLAGEWEKFVKCRIGRDDAQIGVEDQQGVRDRLDDRFRVDARFIDRIGGALAFGDVRDGEPVALNWRSISCVLNAKSAIVSVAPVISGKSLRDPSSGSI